MRIKFRAYDKKLKQVIHDGKGYAISSDRVFVSHACGYPDFYQINRGEQIDRFIIDSSIGQKVKGVDLYVNDIFTLEGEMFIIFFEESTSQFLARAIGKKHYSDRLFEPYPLTKVIEIDSENQNIKLRKPIHINYEAKILCSSCKVIEMKLKKVNREPLIFSSTDYNSTKKEVDNLLK